MCFALTAFVAVTCHSIDYINVKSAGWDQSCHHGSKKGGEAYYRKDNLAASITRL